MSESRERAMIAALVRELESAAQGNGVRLEVIAEARALLASPDTGARVVDATRSYYGRQCDSGCGCNICCALRAHAAAQEKTP